ncbi:isoaspartyl peptidase/L-asparaginase family protein [Devriesea agamarum]|uniref:isoaspartyl peptidase/L-asparaginase family protein n=1 Tax=Devriesea agamarum TaxID=472569 RepID=UPI001E55DCE3|nr:isoaspartyl peptidase/L-asparaginase [Devriesea agamarum]
MSNTPASPEKLSAHPANPTSSLTIPGPARTATACPTRAFSIVVHAGAGSRTEELSLEAQADYEEGLRAAHAAGEKILERGGSAVDAVCAAVAELEDNPLFNAGRGAALTSEGRVELDACVMDGGSNAMPTDTSARPDAAADMASMADTQAQPVHGLPRAGAVATLTGARNPVRMARAVLDEGRHVLMMGVDTERIAAYGCETAPAAYFITEARRTQLERVRAGLEEGEKHGTVGAVARDASGRLAAATSTGGLVNQAPGRVGDTPVAGAGTYARTGLVAISCTGTGEAFIEACTGHEIASRMRYREDDLETALAGVLDEEIGPRCADGGIIGVDARGRIVVALNAEAMFAAWRDGDEIVVTV